VSILRWLFPIYVAAGALPTLYILRGPHPEDILRFTVVTVIEGIVIAVGAGIYIWIRSRSS